MEKNPRSLVALASLVKRHTFKENKWKAHAHSGIVAPWFERISNVQIAGVEVPVKIEVPLSHTAEFFISFQESYTPAEKSQIFVERESFPPLESAKDFYLCDALGEVVLSPEGRFVIKSYFENGDPSAGISSLSLILEKEDNPKVLVEIPSGVLSRKENSWFVEDIGLWIEVSSAKGAQSDE